MLLISADTHDPFLNLALEEVLLKNRQSEYLILGVNSPSVVIGKHQAAHREVNTKFVTENRIPVIRRISGGGTVFHDKGNLNFTFIRESEEGRQIDFKKYTLPVIGFLNYMGINARLEGKSDIKVDGLKVSGNAEHVYRNRVLHHGTLLFSSAIDSLKNSIRDDKSCYATRAVNSNPASVTNLKERLGVFADMDDFTKAIIDYFKAEIPELESGSITGQDLREASELAEARYRQWEWNYAYGPDYVFRNSFQLGAADHSCTIFVKSGLVSSCTIEGGGRLSAAAGRLEGCRHMVSDFQKVFDEEEISLQGEGIYNFF